MTIKDFYDIAEYANNNWRGSFAPRDLCEFAYEYYTEYKTRMVERGSPLDKLLTQLVADYNAADGENITDVVDLGSWLEAISWDLGYTSYSGWERFLDDFS